MSKLRRRARPAIRRAPQRLCGGDAGPGAAQDGVQQAQRRPAAERRGLVGAVVAVHAWDTAVQAIGAQNAVLLDNLVPTTAFVIAVAGGHAPSAWELRGAATAVAALVVAKVLSRRSDRAAAR